MYNTLNNNNNNNNNYRVTSQPGNQGKVREFSMFDQKPGKTRKRQGKTVALITFNNVFSIVYFNFYYLLMLTINENGKTNIF